MAWYSRWLLALECCNNLFSFIRRQFVRISENIYLHNNRRLLHFRAKILAECYLENAKAGALLSGITESIYLQRFFRNDDLCDFIRLRMCHGLVGGRDSFTVPAISAIHFIRKSDTSGSLAPRVTKANAVCHAITVSCSL